MPSRPALRFLICAALPFFIVGCYGHGMYGPYGGGYGYPPQRGYFSNTPYAQPQYLPQYQGSQQYPGSYNVPGGVVVPPSDSTYAPGGTLAPGSPGTTIIPDDGWSSGTPVEGTGATFDYGSDGSNLGYGIDNGGVPTPPDADRMFDGDTFGSTTSRLDATASAYRQPQTSTRPTGNQTYGHDSGFKWLRGIVGRAPDGRYEITYDLQPPASDDYAGTFQFVADAQLQNLRRGEIVEVTGDIDRSQTDSGGKPYYRVGSIKKLMAH